MGIEVRFVDPSDPENFLKATDENTRAYYGEVLPNPSFEVFPIAEVAALGKPLGIPLIVDNTAAPVICKPFDHGASIIMHSTTKYIGGHGTSIGGIIVDSGNFDWEAFQKDNLLLIIQILLMLVLFGLKQLNHLDQLLIYLKQELLF